MSSTSAMFDFSNEGDCILANDSLKLRNDAVSADNGEFTFSYMDLMLLSAIYD